MILIIKSGKKQVLMINKEDLKLEKGNKSVYNNILSSFALIENQKSFQEQL